MQCSCGGETVLKSHCVKSEAKIIEWLGKSNDKPIRVERNICNGCGRQDVRILDQANGSVLSARG